MRDADLIQRAQEAEYTVADQRRTIDDLVVELEELQEANAKMATEIACLKISLAGSRRGESISMNAFNTAVSRMHLAEKWVQPLIWVATVLAIAVVALLAGIFAR